MFTQTFLQRFVYDFCAAIVCQGFVEFNRNLPTAGEAVWDLIVSVEFLLERNFVVVGKSFRD